MSLLYAHVELVVGRLEFILPVVMTVNLWALSYVKGGESGLVSTPYLLYNCGVQLLTEITVDGLVSTFGPPKPYREGMMINKLWRQRIIGMLTIVFSPATCDLLTFLYPHFAFHFAMTQSGHCVAISPYLEYSSGLSCVAHSPTPPYVRICDNSTDNLEQVALKP